MGINNFKPFAAAGAANVMTQADFEAMAALLTGFQSGTAQSRQLNKVWRQSSIMSAVLAQFIVDRTGQDAIDDGTTSNLLANLKASAAAVNGDSTKTFSVATATQSQHAIPLAQAKGRLLNVQKWTARGAYSYTPTAGTTAAYAECQGAGGSGGGTAATGANQCAVGGGGGSGAFCSSWFPNGIAAGTIITIGQGGAQVNGSSSNGGSSSIGSLMSAPGGNGGTTAGPTTAPWLTGGGRGATGIATGGNLVNTSGQSGDASFALTSGSALIGGAGAASIYGGGGGVVGGNTAGLPSVAPGSGGSGAATGASQASIAGGPGADGAVFIYEYGTI